MTALIILALCSIAVIALAAAIIWSQAAALAQANRHIDAQAERISIQADTIRLNEEHITLLQQAYDELAEQTVELEETNDLLKWSLSHYVTSLPPHTRPHLVEGLRDRLAAHLMN